MFINNLNPTLVKIGFFEIRFYGLVYFFGFLFSYFLLLKNKKRIGLKREEIENLFIFIFLGLLLGARIAHFLFKNPALIFSSEFFKIWHGGMSFFGGLAGCLLFAFLYLKHIKKTSSFIKTADLLAPLAAIFLGFGRIANFINSEFIGTPSNLPWCTIFIKLDNICRHPYQLYAALSHFILFFVLFYFLKTRNKLKHGFLFYNFLIFYSLFRFITDFFRQDTRFLGLCLGQYTSLFVFILSLILLKNNLKKQRTLSKNYKTKN